ncbi:WD domain, G-beta repeat, putative [Trypanosoma equiperdum]|uniref:WD domain, G-beta repeat, putative n=1 Tax=Trypanosoma equiperdum TaxID=5694 RepID=A0A1G4I0J1_TRYEQ|nr:WD domain, G-beta repeat, putative [Trypanosoma equiperdum]
MDGQRATKGVGHASDWAELRRALFNVHLLLALQEGSVTQPLGEEKVVASREASQPLLERGCGMNRVQSVSLMTLELEDSTDALHSQCLEKHEEKRGVCRALPLPPLRWAVPSHQQRLAALEKERRRRQRKNAAAEGKLNMLGNTLGSGDTRQPSSITGSSATAKVMELDKNVMKEDLQDGTASPAHSTRSSLTRTGDHSECESSQDTYTAAFASVDDHCPREMPSFRLSSGSDNSDCQTLSRTISTLSVRKTLAPVHEGHRCASVYRLLGAGSSLSEDTTAHMAQTEVEQICSGEAEPYTSYLFSPVVRVVDLSEGRGSPTPPGGNEDRMAPDGDLEMKDGCTRVSFSPNGECYVVGTRRGFLWLFTTGSPPGQNNIYGYGDEKGDGVCLDEEPPVEPLKLQAHGGPVTDVTFNDVGTLFASAGGDACVILWNQRTRLKVRRINTGGGVPTLVRFVPENNNYLLVSLMQHRLLRLYNTSTGRPVTRRGAEMRIEASTVAVHFCADPFLFIGDTSGTVSMWRYYLGCEHTCAMCPLEPRRSGEWREGRASSPAVTGLLPHGVASGASSTRGSIKERCCQVPAVVVENQPCFEKAGSLLLEKGTPVGALAVSTMTQEQLRYLKRAQRIGWKIPKRGLFGKLIEGIPSEALNRNNSSESPGEMDASDCSKLMCAVMLLASLPCDRMAVLCIQAKAEDTREYTLVPMLVVDRACRIRHMSTGAAFCTDNVRSPTFTSTCEEGFVQIIACTAARMLPVAKEETAATGSSAVVTPWAVMATLPVPCGGSPSSLAWSPDMRILTAVTEEGMVYQWRRVQLHQGTTVNEDINRDADDGLRASTTRDEVDEWRRHFEREKKRQLHRYRARKNAANQLEDTSRPYGGLNAGSGSRTSVVQSLCHASN